MIKKLKHKHTKKKKEFFGLFLRIYFLMSLEFSVLTFTIYKILPDYMGGGCICNVNISVFDLNCFKS